QRAEAQRAKGDAEADVIAGAAPVDRIDVGKDHLRHNPKTIAVEAVKFETDAARFALHAPPQIDEWRLQDSLGSVAGLDTQHAGAAWRQIDRAGRTDAEPAERHVFDHDRQHFIANEQLGGQFALDARR